MPIRGVIEVTRRIALLGGLMAAVALAFLTRFEPMMVVSVAEAPAAAGAADSTADGIGAARSARRSAEVVTVNGPAWETFFAGVTQSFAANYPIAGWERHVLKRDLEQARKDNASRGAMDEAAKADEADRVKRLREKYGVDVTFTGSFRRLYFAAREQPFDAVASQWKEGSTHLLTLPGSAARLEVFYQSPVELHGFSDVFTLPEGYAFPLRPLAPWVALAALLLYVLLPWGRIPLEVVAYARWRVILSDVAMIGLLSVPFFAMPILIIGGTKETFTQWLPFAAFFWLLAALGMAGVFWSASMAAYRLTVLPDKLSATALSGAIEIPYAAVRAVQPVVLRPPKWLIVASWIAAFLGTSRSASVGQVGRSLLLSSSAANGLRLDLTNGTHYYIWFSDQMGGTAVEHFGRLNAALRREGIAWADEATEVRALVPPTH